MHSGRHSASGPTRQRQQTSDNAAPAVMATEGTPTRAVKEAVTWVTAVSAAPGATVNCTAAVNIAKGKVTNEGSINATAFEGDLTNNSRTYIATGGGIVNVKPIVARLAGNGRMTNDSASVNICTGPGDIVHNNSIRSIGGNPRP